MRIDFSCNREKSLHMYNLFFLKLSENILSYKKPKKKLEQQQQQHKHKKHPKRTQKKASNINFSFLLFLMGCKNPYFTYKP